MAACGDDEPRLLFSTEHFDYFIDSDASTPCEGTAYWLERHYHAYARFFDVSLPPGRKIHYRLFPNPQALEDRGCRAAGCTSGTEISSRFSLFSHEIVHAVAHLAGSPPRVFQEGIAVVLGEVAHNRNDTPVGPEYPLDLLLETEKFDAQVRRDGFGVYRDAASFVRFLLDRFGREKFLALYRSIESRASRKRIDDVFLSLYQTPLTTVFLDWRAQPPAHRDDVSMHLVECAEPPLVPSEEASDDGVCGYLNYSFGRALVRPFRVEEDGSAELTLSLPEQAGVSIFRCNGGDAIGGIVPLNDWGAGDNGPVRFMLDLPPDDYFVAVARIGAERGLDARLELDSAMATEACSARISFVGQEIRLFSIRRWQPESCLTPSCPTAKAAMKFETSGSLEFYAPTNRSRVWSLDSMSLCQVACPEGSRSCSDVSVTTVRAKLGDFAAGAIVQAEGWRPRDGGFYGFGLRLTGIP